MQTNDFRVVSGDPSWIEEGGPDGKVAVVASWSATPVMSRSLSQYLFELEKIGFLSLVINTSELDQDLEWPHGKPDSTVVVVRPNVGYDFGSWAAALDRFPKIRGFGQVLLTNDSLVGPFAPLTEIATAMNETGADLFGLTENLQHHRHMQSFFVCFKGGILNDRPWLNFFAAVRAESSKDDIVQKYELGLTRTAQRYGYSWVVMLTTESLEGGIGNPTFERWDLLLDEGVPFVKRSLITHSQYRATRAELVDAIALRYNEDLDDWMPDGLKAQPKKGGSQ